MTTVGIRHFFGGTASETLRSQAHRSDRHHELSSLPTSGLRCRHTRHLSQCLHLLRASVRISARVCVLSLVLVWDHDKGRGGYGSCEADPMVGAAVDAADKRANSRRPLEERDVFPWYVFRRVLLPSLQGVERLHRAPLRNPYAAKRREYTLQVREIGNLCAGKTSFLTPICGQTVVVGVYDVCQILLQRWSSGLDTDRRRR